MGIGFLRTEPKLTEENIMRPGILVTIILVILVIAALPAWPYSAGWGYYPTGGLGLILLIVLILALLGRI